MRVGTALQQPWDLSELPAGDPLPLGLVDYAGRAAYDHGRTFGDRRITTSGFIGLDESGNQAARGSCRQRARSCRRAGAGVGHDADRDAEDPLDDLGVQHVLRLADGDEGAVALCRRLSRPTSCPPTSTAPLLGRGAR